MEWPANCVLAGRNDTSPKMHRRLQMRNELLELYVIYQARLLHPLDAQQWTDIFQRTVNRLLAVKPLEALSKRGRLGVVMTIVGSRSVKLFAPTVLAVLACDWHNEWASLKLLEDAVRQASLSRIRCLRPECKRGEDEIPRDWSRKLMASILEEGVKAAVARSWRTLHIGGVARERVEKTGRELRALAARCRGAVDRSRAQQLIGSYLKSYRLGGFIQALVTWGQDQLRETTKPSIFNDAFGFLDERMVEASRARAGQWRANELNRASATNAPRDGEVRGGDSTPLRELENGAGSLNAPSRRGQRLQRSPAVSYSARAVDGGAAGRGRARGGGGRVGSSLESWPAAFGGDTPGSPVESGTCSKPGGEGVGAVAEQRSERQSGGGSEEGGVSIDDLAGGGNFGANRKTRFLGVLRVGAKVLLKRGATTASASPALWKAGVLTAIRGDGTYDVRYDDGEVDHIISRGDIFGGEDQALKLPGEDARSSSEDVSRDGTHQTKESRRRKKRVLASLVDDASPLSTPEAWQVVQDSSQDRVDGEDARVDDALLPSPAATMDTVDQRGTAGRIRRKYLKRRILQEDGEDRISDRPDGAAPATGELPSAERESPVRTPGTSTGVGKHGPGPNDGAIKSSRTRLENLLEVANSWAGRTGDGGRGTGSEARGDGDASAGINLGAEGIDATRGRLTSPPLEDAPGLGTILEGSGHNGSGEHEEGMRDTSVTSIETENTVSGGAGVGTRAAGGGIEKDWNKGVVERQRGATRDGKRGIAGAELDSKNDPKNCPKDYSRRDDLSAVVSAKETEDVLMKGEESLERAALGQEMCGRRNQEGNAAEKGGGSVARRFASSRVARAKENAVLTRARMKRVRRERPSAEGSAHDGERRKKKALSTAREEVESDDDDDPAEGDRLRPKQGQEETDLEVETEGNGPSRRDQEEGKGGGRLPASGRKACQGFERVDTPRSSFPQPEEEGDHLVAAVANTPTPNPPTPRWARVPVRRTRRPLSPKAESGGDERPNGPLLEDGPQGSQSDPRAHGECISRGHDVRTTRLLRRHEQPARSDEERRGEGAARKGGGGGVMGESDQPAGGTERVDGQGGEVGETEFATPTAMMRTPAATRRITTADLAGSADSSSAARDEDEVCVVRDAEAEGPIDTEERAYGERVDTQIPKRPPKFMRVYGSVGITRVRRSIQNLFGQR